ncbi:hypothetical protein BDV32DRAFT_146425 [Aspergillus pseudonomiae]|nr:hypothetical protein BDV32DRAFT_146425 [Aspergillus pseudonomiae]
MSHFSHSSPVDSGMVPSSSSTEDHLSPTLSASIVLPAQLNSFAKAYGIPPSSIVQLGWALLLRCHLAIPSPCWSTIDDKTMPRGSDTHALQWESLHLDESRSISWILQRWEDPSVHWYLSSDQLPGSKSPALTTMLFLVKEDGLFDPVTPIDPGMGTIIYFYPSDEQPRLHISWNPDLVSSGHAFHLTRSLEHALQTIFLAPNVDIRDVNLFGIWDHQQLLQWNSYCPDPVDRLVQEMFQDVVAATPEASAVAAWDGELNYRELDRLSSRLAGVLQSDFGVVSETIVALCFEKSVWAIVAMLAVVKAGGAFLHIDPQHPPARHQAMIKSTASKLFLCSEQTRDKVVRSVPDCPSLVIHREMFAAQPDHAQQDTVISSGNLGPTNAAYVVCTSGSTGTPKAIVVEHVSLCSSVTAQAKAMDITAGSRVLQYAAYTFDVSIGDIFAALTHGACICIPSNWERAHDLSGAINRLGVNQACLTSTVASLLTPVEVPKLKKLTLGGEPATQHCINMWVEKVALKNIYGPAECTVWCIIQPDVSSGTAVSNIGHAIGARAWIVHPENHDRLMPIGAVGELLIEGPLVARGYLNDPVKTNAVFLAQPPIWLASFGPPPPRSRFYKTGDLARYGPGGALLFEGRKDTQVKLRGQRIELGEVEYRLHQALSDLSSSAAVELVHPKESTAPLLCAFITWDEGIDLDLQPAKPPLSACLTPTARKRFNHMVSLLQTEMERTLPAYMIPGLCFPVHKLPLTTSGKLDRKALRYFCTQHSLAFLSTFENKNVNSPTDGATDSFAAPLETVSPAESTLAQLWAQVLGMKTDSISRKDNFLSLGGDSLAAMRLVNRAARDAQLTLTVADVFKCPVLADQASLVRPLVQTRNLVPFELMAPGDLQIEDLVAYVAEKCGVLHDQVEDIYPCTPLQDEMMRDSLSGDRTQMGQEVILLAEDLDLPRYLSACARVFQRFPILRTRFVQHSDRLIQVVIRETLSWQRPESLAAYVEADAKEAPALNKPLTRWALTSDSTHCILTMHHSIFDGISLGHILGAIYAVYQSIPLPPDSVSFAAFLAQINEHPSDLSDESKQFWRSYLRPSPGSGDLPLPIVDSTYRPCANCGTQRLVTFQSGVVPALQQHGLTEATLIRGAWACTLAQLQTSSTPSDVVFGTILTGRNLHLPGVDALVAPTLTHAPIRIRMSAASNEKPASFLARVQADATAMIPFEHDGMDRIRAIDAQVRAVCDEMQTLLVIQPIPEGLTSASTSPFPGPILSGPRVEAREMRHFHWYGLLVECTLLPTNGFFVRMCYDDKLFSSEDVEKLLDDYSQALHELGGGLTEGEVHLPTEQKLDTLTLPGLVAPSGAEEMV